MIAGLPIYDLKSQKWRVVLMAKDQLPALAPDEFDTMEDAQLAISSLIVLMMKDAKQRA